jgi:riboflavin synthase
MFTGLVQQIGKIEDLRRSPGGTLLRVSATYKQLVLGESIAVNGCCLTVTTILADGFTADASQETLDKTTVGALRVGSRVHLERALSMGDKLGGHLVTGHVDGVGKLVQREPLGDAVRVTFEVPDTLAPLIAPKGSVTLDGTSLTVNSVRGTRFDVVLVPFTQKETLFGERAVGDGINVEVDVLAKYVARLLGRPGVDGTGGEGTGLTLEALSKAGFVRG